MYGEGFSGALMQKVNDGGMLDSQPTAAYNKNGISLNTEIVLKKK
jgi:hypothetical protein